MASPPYNHSYTSAVSPPYPSNAQLPQPPKRRQSDMPSAAPAIKRRKASMLSTVSAGSAHPLRQTSFPPESAQGGTFSRSPTEDSVSLVSGVTNNTSTKKKRGRKSKGKDDGSTVNGAGGSKGKRRASRDEDAEAEDEDEGGGDDLAVQMAAGTLEEKKKEMEHRALLTSVLDPDQFARFEAWRSSRLSDAVVRRIVNQTLSQSAPANVILAVKSVAKIFAGEMIEGARKVQTQWLEVSREDESTGEPLPDGVLETRRGPLQPDHMREAMRRHRLTREGGLPGQLGLWQQQQQSGGVRFGIKSKGKRLFK